MPVKTGSIKGTSDIRVQIHAKEIKKTKTKNKGN